MRRFVQEAQAASSEPDISPDGHLIARFSNDAQGVARLAVLSFDNGLMSGFR
jgi:hypothetical protein